MRHLAGIALALILASCSSEGLPIGVNSPAGGGGGNGGDGGSVSTDMARAPMDLSTPLMPSGGKCKTACDCVAGLACRQGKCGQSMFGMVYCCESMTCPSGSVCQSGTDGDIQQCGGGGNGGGPGGGGGGPGGGGGGPGGSTDGGSPGFCMFIPCSSNGTCTMSGCGSCDTNTGRCK